MAQNPSYSGFVPDFMWIAKATPFHFRLKLVIAHTTIYDDYG